ncbi:hypothetical protein PP715_18870 [Ralstonia solanacearum]|uniref:hypothetical protein n=1 Tax=Ralstonia solanacearum TaxID=305 RepID=UPI0005ACE15C|nr:hypothetical protein [Ralstonia solanacearum]AMP72543.1 hypothetical protein UW163_23705 [Ralstonia solanacearum]MCL9841489.1 hypothetical protein [Ralstonia solanacearum]MDB0533855.1 hypothetical protein [Ralstonia solanacearum]MDB0538562.1 hypothetical protein [Ralstonia solanacearum]MDB0548470.1 hypothetical protein [Ralstonia solanacearum]
MSFQYSKEARERICSLGPAVIAEFVDEIPQGVRKPLYDRYPRAQGFRPGRAEFKERQKRLIALLTHPQASPKGAPEWRHFAYLWEAWGRHRLGQSLPREDDTAPAADAGVTFLKALAERSPDVAREDVERLFQFSGFPDHPDVGSMLARFRLSSVLARDRMIDGMPARLANIEARLKDIDSETKATTRRAIQLETTCAGLARSAPESDRGVDERAAELSGLREALENESLRGGERDKTIEALGAAGGQLIAAVKATNDRLATLEKSLSASKARHDELAGIFAEVGELRKIVDGLAVQIDGWAGWANSMADVTRRFEAQEASPTFQQTVSESGLRARLVVRRPNEAFIDLHRVEDACELIASNLQATGVTRGAAIGMARQMAAALTAGQLIQLTGSLADLMAESVAAAIGGPVHHEWCVPVGLVSDDPAADCVRSLTGNSGCLLMKGANRSAFEVYGNAIRDIVVRRQFGATDQGSLALIATWAQGPATFPDGGTLAELGPVFDTDTLAMRSAFARLPEKRYGRLAADDWAQLEGLDAELPAPGELVELLDEAGFDGGALCKRVMHRGYAMLRCMPQGTQDADLHALLMTWAVPWAKATGGPAEGIRQLAERQFAERRTEEDAA